MEFVHKILHMCYSAVETAIYRNGSFSTTTNHKFMDKRVSAVTGKLADKPTRGQSSRGLVNSWTSQHAEI